MHTSMYLHFFVFYTTCQYAWMKVFSIINTLQMHRCLVTLQGCISLICFLHHSIGAFPYCFGKRTLWDFGGLYGYMENDSFQWVFLSRVFFTYWVILWQWLGTTRWWKGSEKNILQICNYDWSVVFFLVHSLFCPKHFYNH